jgi:hypothetical protein
MSQPVVVSRLSTPLPSSALAGRGHPRAAILPGELGGLEDGIHPQSNRVPADHLDDCWIG